MAKNYLPIGGPGCDDLLAEVGWALTQWSHVEMALNVFFNLISGIDDSNKSSAIMDSLLSFKARVDVCSALIRYEPAKYVDDKMWKKLAEKLNDAYKARHQIAHFTLLGEDNKIYISPFMSFDKLTRRTHNLLPKSEITALRAHFKELYDALLWIRNEAMIATQPSKPLQPVQPEPALIAQIRARLAQKPKGH